MGYNIEVSFNILKNSSVTEIINTVKKCAEECGCEYHYYDYEYESNNKIKRNHCIITIIFIEYDLLNLLYFLEFIVNKKCLYLESIYDDDLRKILYASQYYITQKMSKQNGKEFKKDRKLISYSPDESLILKTIKNKN